MNRRPESPRRLSWRDPDGFVVRDGERILRAISEGHAGLAATLFEAPWYQRLVDEGALQRSTWTEAPPHAAAPGHWRWIEHPRLAFPCYPHEITALQLYDAGKLTLRVAREALRNGWLLKDASAWNVLFDAGRPVFCDVLSFVRPDGASMIWPAYAQCCRHFVIPLLLYRHLGIEPAGVFAAHREGMAPEKARRMLRGLVAYRQPALETVTLPAFFARKAATSWGAQSLVARNTDIDRAHDAIGKTLARLDRHLDALRPGAQRQTTAWSEYEDSRTHYSEAELEQKRAFVRTALATCAGPAVLDLGCNTGEFSAIAAVLGKRVVAADSDHAALTKLYARVREGSLDITPLVLDVGRTTPALGWLNLDVEGFVERARGKFDSILALGLVHHLLVSERASLEMILGFFSVLEPRLLVIEWVDPLDPRFMQIAGPNHALYAGLSAARFEAVFGSAFRLVDKKALGGGTRVLYHWERLE